MVFFSFASVFCLSHCSIGHILSNIYTCMLCNDKLICNVHDDAIIQNSGPDFIVRNDSYISVYSIITNAFTTVFF